MGTGTRQRYVSTVAGDIRTLILETMMGVRALRARTTWTQRAGVRIEIDVAIDWTADTLYRGYFISLGM